MNMTKGNYLCRLKSPATGFRPASTLAFLPMALCMGPNLLHSHKKKIIFRCGGEAARLKPLSIPLPAAASRRGEGAGGGAIRSLRRNF